MSWDFKGRILLDRSRPAGEPRKVLDCSRLGTLGWSPRTALADGVKATYEWYVQQRDGAGVWRLRS